MAWRGWGVVTMMALLVVGNCWTDTRSLPPPSSVRAVVPPAASHREQDTRKNLFCYYSLPSLDHRPSPLPPAALNATLCTHIFISSAELHNTTIVPRDTADIQVYKDVLSLKEQNPSLHVLIRVEGNWTDITSDPLAVALFAYNAGRFLKTYDLDGLEVAWQPPSWPPWGSGSMQHLSILLLQLNNAIKLASHPAFLLSVAVSSSQKLIDQAYDVRVLNRTVDFVNVATYNFHTYKPYLPFTGHGAPLKPQEVEQGYWETLNTQWAVRYWLGKGLPREKIVLTIPTFANTWKLLSSAWTGIGAPAVGLGIMGGHMTYSEACVFIQQGSAWKWDKASEVPYAWRSREWVSYEDQASVREKVVTVTVSEAARHCCTDPCLAASPSSMH